MRTIHQLFICNRASAAVEAAIFVPIFMLFTFGITDLGSQMFVRQQINAAAQAGAMYTLINSGTGSVCETMTGDCLTGVHGAMNDAFGSSSFCSGTVCDASIDVCDDGSPKCITISADYPITPILPSAVYSWAQLSTASYTTTIRIQ